MISLSPHHFIIQDETSPNISFISPIKVLMDYLVSKNKTLLLTHCKIIVKDDSS